MPMRIRRIRVKICLVGDRGVGKTSLIRRYAAGQFHPDEKGTLGAHLHPIEVEIPLSQDEVAKVRADLFDMMGEHALRANFRDAIFYGTHGLIAVCDLGRKETLDNLYGWVETATSVAGEVPVAVAFNKADLGKGIAIGSTDMRELGERLPQAVATVTSARTGANVEDTFNGIILRAVEGILGARANATERAALRNQILGVIARRETTGRSKADVVGAFRAREPKVVMEELDNLVDLGLIRPVEFSLEQWTDTASVPVTTHFVVTPEGKAAAAANQAGEIEDTAT